MEQQQPLKVFIKKELGVELPDSFANFLATHGECLDNNPFNRSKWKSGFGDVHFIVGTTKAFRSQFPDFPKPLVIIGYVGEKAIVVNHQITSIDVYIALDVETEEIYMVDGLGKLEKAGKAFDEWFNTFIVCLKNHEQPHKHKLLEYLKSLSH